ncbi:lipopolysaccharide transport periplasmic protein LptA [Pseudoalteromonas tunicata]|uniref:lipopolysaccharide transport periplasmic protein LptA n=1 Tax=Pseudoalteromonas tunicata TaxID=314281 RepID=UPI00273EC7E7|nr:lipopolysaccharide transport periplasmic protein LptA [Pseudoalteromonas tunicata]MDP4983243.1 lipopolysaccharide transport periplasmic protein LptA [Pseudoalteromonas tunicata]MDP5215173.1 lipopolysaccharide transport periplasmic protein LptA [Pseudoalteromonas tunicata]
MTNKPILILALLGMSFFSSANNEKSQVLIDADKQQAELKRNVVIFEKNVEVTHGKRSIKADFLEAYRRAELGENKELLIARGHPARYSETLPDGNVITASADEISYDVASAILTISGNASITQSGQKISAENIIYDINQQLISAEKAENSNQRVRTILTAPEKDKK